LAFSKSFPTRREQYPEASWLKAKGNWTARIDRKWLFSTVQTPAIVEE